MANTAYSDSEPQAVWTAQTSTSHEDALAISKLRNLFRQAQQYRRPVVDQWRKNYRVLRNRTWVTNRADWAPSPEVPEIYPIVASRVGWMTDQRPEIDVTPAIPANSTLYNFYSAVSWDLQTAIQSVWDTNHFDDEIEKCLWDGHVYGVGFLKSCWDATLDGGLGNIAMRRVDPFTLYIDPQATSLEDANYIIEARTISLQEADRRWPGTAALLKNQSTEERVDKAPNRLDQTPQGPPKANPGAISPATDMRYGLPGMSRMSAPDMYINKGVTVYECWIREHYLDHEDKDDTDIIDSWRVIVYTGQHMLMNESAYDLWNFGDHPYSRFVLEDMGELYGLSFVELLIPSQLAINRLLAAIQLNVELSGNPIFLEGQRSGLSKMKITNRPGQRIAYNDSGAAPSWLMPPQVNPQMLQMIQFYITEMERVSGMSGVIRGEISGRPSADSLDTITDAAFVRVRMAQRQLEYTLKNQAILQAALITEFYDEPRMVAAVGPSGQNTSLFIKPRHFLVPKPNNTDDNDDLEPLKYEIMLNAGSQNATSAQSRRNDAQNLFAMGALDAQAILEVYNWPNRDVIIQRIQAAMAAQQFQPPGARQRSKRQS